MVFAIRNATESEASCLAAILREASRDVAERFGLTPENCPKHPSNCTSKWIEAGFEKGIAYYILRVDSVPCGCVALEQANPDACYFYGRECPYMKICWMSFPPSEDMLKAYYTRSDETSK